MTTKKPKTKNQTPTTKNENQSNEEQFELELFKPVLEDSEHFFSVILILDYYSVQNVKSLKSRIKYTLNCTGKIRA